MSELYSVFDFYISFVRCTGRTTISGIPELSTFMTRTQMNILLSMVMASWNTLIFPKSRCVHYDNVVILLLIFMLSYLENVVPFRR